MDGIGSGESTKSKQFSTKVHALQEFNQRIIENDLPNAKEISHNIKYFNTTLISWVKDTKSCFIPAKFTFDSGRFPTFNYEVLYDTLVELLGHVEKIDDNDELVDALVKALACMVPFLPDETILSLPTTYAECLYEVTPSFQTKIINLLVQYIIPLIYVYMTPDVEDEMADMNLCVPSLLAGVLDASTDIGIWTKVMECLMRFKRNVSTDLLTVLAYGTRESLEASVYLLNRYFPPVDIASVKAYQSPPYESIKPYTCQSETCIKTDPMKEAVKICLDPSLCAMYNDEPPPMYFCQGCYDKLDKSDSKLFLDVVQPVTLVSQVCDNVDCRFGFMKALYFCFSLECTIKNDFKPIRLCEDCHTRLHGSLENPHMNHECLQELWKTPNPEQTYLVDAIVRLWNEAQPDYHEKCLQMGVEIDNSFLDEVKQMDPLLYIKKIFRSLHGLYLLKTTCPIPPSQYHLEHLTRLLSMLLIWVESVGYATHPKVVPVVKQSRQQAIGWINKVLQYDSNLLSSCLLPNPPIYARCGHPWNTFTSVVRKDLEVLQRLSTLSKQELLPEQIWDHIMPQWMEEIREQIPVDEIKSFKKVIGKLFDIKSDTRPPFAINFIKKRLESSIIKQSQEGLVWVQILSYLDVQMDIKNLLEMFIEMVILKEEALMVSEFVIPSAFPFPDKKTLQGVTSTGKLSRQNSLTPGTPLSGTIPILTNVKDDLSISILIMDVLIKQLTLQKSSDGKVYIAQKESTVLNLLLVCILDQSFKGDHGDHVTAECTQCNLMNVIFYQVALLVDLSVKHQVSCDQAKTDYSKNIILRTSSNSSRKSWKSQTSNSYGTSTDTKPGDSISSKTIAEEQEEMENKDEEVFSDSKSQKKETTDIAERRKRLRYASQKTSKEDEIMINLTRSDVSDSALFAIPELQILEKILQQLDTVPDTSVIVHILSSIDILCIRGECLLMVSEQDKELLHKLQTQTLIPSLWHLLKSSVSNIAQQVVPLLLHCISLPYGAKRLCGKIEEGFTNEDWKVRFAAVEKVGLICQFLSTDLANKSSEARSAVVHGLVYLVFSVEDVSQLVSTRARSMIQSINIKSLTSIYEYLNYHFIKIPEDRIFLLHVYRTINTVIPQWSPMNGKFFVMLLKIIKPIDEKGKQTISRDSSIDNLDLHSGDVIPIYSRHFTVQRLKSPMQAASKSIVRTGYSPVAFYRNSFTLKAGKSWMDGIASPDKPDISGMFRYSCGSEFHQATDTALDTVSEECEAELKQTISLQKTVTGDEGSTEDEVLCLFINILVEFLVRLKDTKSEKNLSKPSFDDVRDIIGFLGTVMGLERSNVDKWSPKKNLDTKRFRRNPVVVAFLVNLPRLLDGNKDIGEFFLLLALQVMETIVCKGVGAHFNVVKSSLVLLEPNLQYAWLNSLIVILYKYDFQDHTESILKLIGVTKNTINGHDNHFCCYKKQKESLSMRHVVNIKIAAKKKIKKQCTKMEEAKNGFELTDFTERKNETGDMMEETPEVDLRPTSRPISDGAIYQGSLIQTTEEILLANEYRHCPLCFISLFQYEEETINLSIVALLTFVHMDASMAAPHVIDMIQGISKKATVMCASNPNKPPQLALTPTASIAQQFLRCVYHKLSQSRVFPEIYRVDTLDDEFHVITSTVLNEFAHLTQICPVKLTLMDLVEGKSTDRILVLLHNMSNYIKHVLTHSQWAALQKTFEDFYSSIIPLIPNGSNMDPLLDIMSSLLSSQKTTFMVLIDLIDDVMTHIIKNCRFSVESLRELSAACCDTFSRERDMVRLTRKIAMIFCMVLSGKISLPEKSVVELGKFFGEDSGTYFYFQSAEKEYSKNAVKKITKAMETLDMNFSHEIIDYLKAPGRRLKENQMVDKSSSESFHRVVKLGVAQFSSVYLSHSDQQDSRLQAKLLSFLVNCNTDDQQNSILNHFTSFDPQELASLFRTTCWLLLALLNHSNSSNTPIRSLFPISKSAAVAEYIKMVFENFASGQDTLRNTRCKSQFQLTFWLAQIWVVYIEKHLPDHIQQSIDINPLAVIKEFWSKLTPVLYKLLQQGESKLQLETIHMFSTLIESMMVHCPRTYTQLIPLWLPMLKVYLNEIPSSIAQKLIGNKSFVESSRKEAEREQFYRWILEMQENLWNTERLSKRKGLGTMNHSNNV